MPDYIIKKEHKMLREELNNLKNCQLTFFTTTITATGLILTVAAKIGPIPIAFLLPIVIIIPSSIIFYDKAWSISRIVGYYRILERFILNEDNEYEYIGWENALKELRDLKNESKDVDAKSKKDSKLYESGSKSGPGNYLNLIYLSYFGLGLFCIYLYYISTHLIKEYSILGDPLFLVLVSAFLLSFIYNLKVLRSLTRGKRSYDYIEEKWIEVFENYKERKVENNNS